MKINEINGTYFFKALIQVQNHWELTFGYYISELEVQQANPNAPYFWPAEVFEDGSIYIPSKGELNETSA